MAPLDELTIRAAGADAKPGTDTLSKSDLAETELAALLDAHRHDETMHRQLIELDYLPASIADRLLRLTRSPSLREDLINRHSFSAEISREAIKWSRHRPQWW